MIKNAIVCDHCGAEKKEANLWWIVRIKGDRPLFMCSPFGSEQDYMQALHYCGRGCAQKAFEQWMDTVVNSEAGNGRGNEIRS